MASQIIIRHDDFDNRLTIEAYQRVHEEFLKRNLIETVNLQFAQFGSLTNFSPSIIRYLRETPNYDIQLHGWEHMMYSNMSTAVITRDLAACCFYFKKFFGKFPEVWYPPWNASNGRMEEIAAEFGIRIDTESYDLKKLLREVAAGVYKGHSVYFHAYQQVELDVLPQVLDTVLTLDKDK